MLDMLKRHQIQVLRDAGHSQQEVAKLATVSVRSVRRVEAEEGVISTDLPAERERGDRQRVAGAEHRQLARLDRHRLRDARHGGGGKASSAPEQTLRR